MTTRGAGSNLGGALVVFFGGVALFLIIRESLNSEAYFRYAFENTRPTVWRWPWRGVAVISLFTLVETSLGVAVFKLERPWRVWQRGVLASAILLVWSGFHLVLVVHSPGFFMLHIIWLWFLALFLLVAALISAGQHARSKLQRTGSRTVGAPSN